MRSIRIILVGLLLAAGAGGWWLYRTAARRKIDPEVTRQRMAWIAERAGASADGFWHYFPPDGDDPASRFIRSMGDVECHWQSLPPTIPLESVVEYFEVHVFRGVVQFWYLDPLPEAATLEAAGRRWRMEDGVVYSPPGDLNWRMAPSEALRRVGNDWSPGDLTAATWTGERWNYLVHTRTPDGAIDDASGNIIDPEEIERLMPVVHCSSNLRRLYVAMMEVSVTQSVQQGYLPVPNQPLRDNTPVGSGSNYWLLLRGRWVQDEELFVCPQQGGPPSEDRCDYLGPTLNPNVQGPSSPLGACVHHPTHLVILQADGAIRLAEPDDRNALSAVNQMLGD